MLDKSRKVQCPACQRKNCWQGQPSPTDELFCSHCRAFIATYDEYIQEMVHREVTRTMVKCTDPESDEEMSILQEAFQNTPKL